MSGFDLQGFMRNIINHPELSEQVTMRQYRKREYIFSQGEVCRDVFFMQRGLVKLYYNTVDGKEWIKSFIADKGIIGSRASQTLGKESPFSALCLEDTELFRLPYAEFEKMCFDDLSLARSVFYFNQWLGVKKEVREYQLLCLSAEEAYAGFVNENPGLVERITQIDIARYLGVTPIALSRIKRRVIDKGGEF